MQSCLSGIFVHFKARTTQQNRDSYFKKKNTCFKQKIA